MAAWLSPTASRPLPAAGRRLGWFLVLLDTGITSWMLALGDWFDRSPVTRVLTLGGHHQVVLAAALAGGVLLLAAAVLTANFTHVGRASGTVLALATGLSVVAAGGLASIAALALLVAVVGRALLR